MVRINNESVNVNPSQDTKQKGTNKTQEKNNDESIFTSTAGEEFVSNLVVGLLDEIFSDGAFTKDEAKAYVAGEKEIAEMIKEEQEKQLDGGHYLTYIFDEANTEKTCRNQYAEEHPEYKEVMKEGQKVESLYESAYNEAKTSWLDENPEPEAYEKGGFFGIKETDAHKEWKANEKEFSKSFEKEYMENNPDYESLYNAKLSDMTFWEALANS